MFNTMVTFWLAYSGLFLIITICSLLNASLAKHLKILIPWINETFRPALMDGGHPNHARDLTLERIPVLEEWEKAARYYTIITYILQFLMFALGAFVQSGHGIPYILLMVIVMLLGSMVMFFPRTVIRRLNVKKAIGFYFIAYAGLMAEIQEKSKDGNNANDLGTDSHS